MKNNILNSIPRRAALIALSLSLLSVPLAEANDIFRPGLIPTDLVVTSTHPVASSAQRINVRARLTRLDTGAPLSGQQITFWYGDPRSPNTPIAARVVTNRDGVAGFTFVPARWGGKGAKVVLAEYLGSGMYARPIPYIRIMVR